MSRSVRDLMFLIGIIAIGALFWPGGSSPLANPPSLLPAVTKTVAVDKTIRTAVRPQGQLSVGGLWLGMARSDVEAIYGPPSSRRENEPGSQAYGYTGNKTNVEAGRFVFVNYDERDKVVSLSGGSLETAAGQVLSGVLEPIEVRNQFGSPDKVGWAGVGMCEGPFAGYGYDKLNLTVTFSLTYGNNFWLGPPSTLTPDEAGKKDDDGHNLSLDRYFKRWGNSDLALPGNQ